MRILPFPGVFKPPSDAVMLAEQLRNEDLARDASVLDVCTGSGYLAIVAAHHGAGEVLATDISRRAVIAARLNARLNGVTVKTARGDLFEPVRGRSFDLIVSNPPYVPSIGDGLPTSGLARAWEAGTDGRAFLDRICAAAPSHLGPGGVLLLVHSAMCSEQATLDALAEQGLPARTVTRSRGPLGPVVRPRAEVLKARGLLADDDSEEIVVVRAQRPN